VRGYVGTGIVTGSRVTALSYVFVIFHVLNPKLDI
jgi:hypothetical protein